jgi:DNA-directed RNA polymerase subunit omega
MAEERASMMEPPIEDLLDKVDSKFTLVTLAARRGRQINSYFNQLGEGLGTVVPPQVTSVSRKPLSIALEEVAVGKIVYTQRVPSASEDGGSATETAPATQENGSTDVIA